MIHLSGTDHSETLQMESLIHNQTGLRLNGRLIEFRESDNMLNLTALTKAGVRHLKHWNDLLSTQNFFKETSIFLDVPVHHLMFQGTCSSVRSNVI